MSRRYETRCWLCQSTDLEPDARGMRCRSCGATFNVILKPGSDPVTMLPDPVGYNQLGLTPKSSSPSAIARRRAAKARG